MDCSHLNYFAFVLQLWLGVSKDMFPVKYFCLITVVGGKQGHVPCKIFLSYNCGWG